MKITVARYQVELFSSRSIGTVDNYYITLKY